MTTVLAIEGADARGKATQVALLAESLRDRGFSVSTVEIPHKNGLTYRLIYRMLRDGSALRHKTLFQIIHFLNKIKFQSFEYPDIRKLDTDYLIMDRWALSSVVYGLASGVSRQLVMSLFNNLIEPDCTIILHGPGFSKPGRDSYERDTTLQDKVQSIYRDWAFDHPRKYKLVHTTGRTREQVAEIVIGTLELSGHVPTRFAAISERLNNALESVSRLGDDSKCTKNK